MACKNSSAVFGLIRYSTIVTAGPSVTSASISTTGSGQCNEGVSGKFVLPARRYRHAAAGPTNKPIAANNKAVETPTRAATKPQLLAVAFDHIVSLSGCLPVTRD